LNLLGPSLSAPCVAEECGRITTPTEIVGCQF
jgi:hypothetical protein